MTVIFVCLNLPTSGGKVKEGLKSQECILLSSDAFVLSPLALPGKT